MTWNPGERQTREPFRGPESKGRPLGREERQREERGRLVDRGREGGERSQGEECGGVGRNSDPRAGKREQRSRERAAAERKKGAGEGVQPRGERRRGWGREGSGGEGRGRDAQES